MFLLVLHLIKTNLIYCSLVVKFRIFLKRLNIHSLGLGTNTLIASTCHSQCVQMMFQIFYPNKSSSRLIWHRFPLFTGPLEWDVMGHSSSLMKPNQIEPHCGAPFLVRPRFFITYLATPLAWETTQPSGHLGIIPISSNCHLILQK